MVFTTIYRIINEYEMANDILQETFIDVFSGIGMLKNTNAIKPWINKIAIRKSVRYLQTKQNFESIDNYKNIEHTNWNGEFTAEDLHIAIQTLPDKARAIFLLIEVEGYKHKEVVKLLNISLGTSKSQLSYAKKLLRIKLKNLYEK